MMLRKLTGILAVWVLSLTLAVAQPPAGDQPAPAAAPDQQGQVGQGGQGGQQDQAGQQRRARPDMAQMQQMMMERTKTRLNATDDEWKAIEPLLQNVNKARMETMGRGAMGMGGRGGRGGRGMGQGGPGGPGGPGAQASAMPERTALETVANDPEAKADDIKAKLKAYREAMAKKEAALKEARNKLREVLSASQEAKLVLDGVLD